MRQTINQQYYKTIGSRIRKQRLAKGMSQNELGRQLGVVSTTVSSYEMGQAALECYTLYRISRVLEVPTNQLLEGDKCLPM